jgi:hypothetical protein
LGIDDPKCIEKLLGRKPSIKFITQGLYNLCTGHAYNEIRKQGMPNETDSSRKKKQRADQTAGMQYKMKEEK